MSPSLAVGSAVDGDSVMWSVLASYATERTSPLGSVWLFVSAWAAVGTNETAVAAATTMQDRISFMSTPWSAVDPRSELGVVEVACGPGVVDVERTAGRA